MNFASSKDADGVACDAALGRITEDATALMNSDRAQRRQETNMHVTKRTFSLLLVAFVSTLAAPLSPARAHTVVRSVDAVPCSLVSPLSPDDPRTTVVAGNPGRASAPSDSTRAIWKGDIVRITASGRIHGGGFLGWVGEHDPNGISEPAPLSGTWPLPGGRKYSLVGGFNDTTQGRFFIGTGPLCLRWNGTDHHASLFDATFLNLAFNDDWTHDNSGQFNVQVDIFWCNHWSAC